MRLCERGREQAEARRCCRGGGDRKRHKGGLGSWICREGTRFAVQVAHGRKDGLILDERSLLHANDAQSLLMLAARERSSVHETS